jgi:signal transduction histidine kinase
LQVLEERERIGKELHDGVIQSLFAVGMHLQGLAAASIDESTARDLESSVEDIDHAIRDLRNYIFGLRPGILADRQLDDAIRQLCQEFEARSGVVTVVDVDGDVAAELSSSAGDVIQIVRESLSNVERHAAATTCRVTLRRIDESRIELTIDDDGVGVAESPTTGMGLANLHVRVEALGGTLEVRSTEGEGTTVAAVLAR